MCSFFEIAKAGSATKKRSCQLSLVEQFMVVINCQKYDTFPLLTSVSNCASY